MKFFRHIALFFTFWKKVTSKSVQFVPPPPYFYYIYFFMGIVYEIRREIIQYFTRNAGEDKGRRSDGSVCLI